MGSVYHPMPLKAVSPHVTALLGLPVQLLVSLQPPLCGQEQACLLQHLTLWQLQACLKLLPDKVAYLDGMLTPGTLLLLCRLDPSP
jgi:hypothetical protein